MPHIEIKYSDNLDIDACKIFDELEKVINNMDMSAGECKSRAYPCAVYKYSHLLLTISLLTKPHRDNEFTQKLSLAIEQTIKKYLKQSLYFSMNIEYSIAHYTTNIHHVEGDRLESMHETTSPKPVN
ncbi:hypothetical protein [Psychromonas sp. Urea-02u-13]|uniref:hypothetical protein n=1 Tax=Psychromonas sp. Urea-02u-13 TaxID=2058326 RepID=UPI000C33CBE9|nr:hypothetical protein [Psychromonas sp. Urea-02u-13]PKG38039.1 hypothetical protein CXF74_15575 [Psychromonas sp. Urea-02u-13]